MSAGAQPQSTTAISTLLLTWMVLSIRLCYGRFTYASTPCICLTHFLKWHTAKKGKKGGGGVGGESKLISQLELTSAGSNLPKWCFCHSWLQEDSQHALNPSLWKTSTCLESFTMEDSQHALNPSLKDFHMP